MKNVKVAASLDPQVLKVLDAYAAQSGLKTANTLLAAAAVELARAADRKLNVWHVLGRIAADDAEPAESPKLRRAEALTIAR